MIELNREKIRNSVRTLVFSKHLPFETVKCLYNSYPDQSVSLSVFSNPEFF